MVFLVFLLLFFLYYFVFGIFRQMFSFSLAKISLSVTGGANLASTIVLVMLLKFITVVVVVVA